MTSAQKEALSRVNSAAFSETDAKLILNWFFGSAPFQLFAVFNVGVVAAIRKLGGEYHDKVGLLKVPNYMPKDGDETK